MFRPDIYKNKKGKGLFWIMDTDSNSAKTEQIMTVNNMQLVIHEAPEFSLVEHFRENVAPDPWRRVSIGLYHADRSCVSSSALKEILRSPAHYQAYLSGAARKETPALFFGQAVHDRMLEPEIFKRDYVIAPPIDRRATEYKEFALTHSAKKILSQEQAAQLEGIAVSIASHRTATHLLENGIKEQTLIWQDEETGIWIKIRPDCLNIEDGICLDLKKTQCASSDAFGRSCAEYGYDVQAALYLTGLRAIFKRDFDFAFLAVEEKIPHGCALYGTPLEMLERGMRRVRHALRTLRECQETGLWPSYQPHGGYDLLVWPKWAQ
jgi:hypothetical protein